MIYNIIFAIVIIRPQTDAPRTYSKQSDYCCKASVKYDNINVIWPPMDKLYKGIVSYHGTASFDFNNSAMLFHSRCISQYYFRGIA